MSVIGIQGKAMLLSHRRYPDVIRWNWPSLQSQLGQYRCIEFGGVFINGVNVNAGGIKELGKFFAVFFSLAPFLKPERSSPILIDEMPIRSVLRRMATTSGAPLRA
jgi:hypothetical protein